MVEAAVIVSSVVAVPPADTLGDVGAIEQPIPVPEAVEQLKLTLPLKPLIELILTLIGGMVLPFAVTAAMEVTGTNEKSERGLETALPLFSV